MELEATHNIESWDSNPKKLLGRLKQSQNNLSERAVFTTELVLELQTKLVDEVEALYQVDVVLEGRRRHGPQRGHVGSGHAHGVDLDALLPGLGRHLRHAVLGTAVRHDDRYVGDLPGAEDNCHTYSR